MTKENQKPEFVVQFLKELQFLEPKRIVECKAFFSEAFLTHADEDTFDEQEYRLEWLNNINFLNDLSLAISDFTAEEIDSQINDAVAILKRKEVAHA